MNRFLFLLVGVLFTGITGSSQQITGIDVSAVQGNIDWNTVAASGKSFAFIKATKGTCYTDSKFILNMSSANAVGIKVGAYHFALPEDNPAETEASFFLTQADPWIGNNFLPPVLDMENPAGTCITGTNSLCSNFTPTQLSQWIEDWCDYVYAHTGIAPIIYISRCIGTQCIATGILNTQKYKLWMAAYDNCQTCPPSNSGNCLGTGIWNDWLFKQYTDQGSLAGITTLVDLDVFNGSPNDFNQLFQPSVIICNNDEICQAKPLNPTQNGSCQPLSCSTVSASADNIPFSGAVNCSTPYQSGRYDDDVWFFFTATDNTPLTLQATPTSNLTQFDLCLGLYTGTCQNPVQISCADKNAKGISETLDFTPIPGQTYWIRVFSYGIGAQYSGDFDICLEKNVTGISPVAPLNNLIAYPNPTTGLLSLKGANIPIGIYTISLYNQLGKSVLTQSIETNTIDLDSTLDLKGLPDGIYYLKISSAIGSETIKVVKNQK